MRTALVDRVIDVTALVREVASTSNGATVLFIGTVRDVNDQRSVTGMEYSAYKSMAEREMHDIARERGELDRPVHQRGAHQPPATGGMIAT